MARISCSQINRGIAAFAMVVTVGTATAHAASMTANAFDNSTVQASGPRTGANGQRFFNIENGSGSFGSFGVVDFHGSDFHFGGTVTGINSAQLVLTESNAAFTAPGNLNLYLTQDTTTPIDAGSSTLAYDSTQTPEGLGTQLTPHDLIGSASFSSTGNTNTGQVDTYNLTLSPSDRTYLIGELNSGKNVRFIITPTDSAVAATYAGFTNTSETGPQLVIDATTSAPEPASLGVLALAGVGLLARRRRA